MNSINAKNQALHSIVSKGFLDYLRQFGKVDEKVAARLLEKVVVREDRRKTRLLEEDQICQDVFYIHTGSAYLTSTRDGKQVVTWISMDHDIITNVESMEGAKAGGVIELAEDSEYLRISFEVFSELCHKFPSFSTLIRRMGSHHFGAMQERINRTQLLTAAEHYAWIREKHPNADRRLPLNIIAGYLGINQASLSRLRRQDPKRMAI